MHGGMHHHHTRKRIYKNLEEYPHPDRFKRIFDKFIYLIVFITPITNIPQLLTIWTKHDASGVSALSWSSFAVISIIWTIYGVLHKDKPIIIMSALLVVVQGLIAIGAIIYQ
ncbi:MAG: SemiSWEET family transporter [Candidatus Colwellbacteria bacterium]